MLPERKYDEWSQQDHKDREYKSEVEKKFFGDIEHPKPAPAELKELFRDFGRYLPKCTIDLSKIDIRPLDPSTDRAAFCCGHEKINNFCRNNAKKQNDVNRVRVYDAFYEGELIGYYYLVASTHLPDVLSPEAEEKFGRVKKAPCIYLGMLGVRIDCQGNGVGKLLMLHAMQNTLRVADIVGIYALTLHADTDDVAAKYKKWGFEPFTKDGEGDRAMYIPLGTIRDAIQPRTGAA